MAEPICTGSHHNRVFSSTPARDTRRSGIKNHLLSRKDRPVFADMAHINFPMGIPQFHSAYQACAHTAAHAFFHGHLAGDPQALQQPVPRISAALPARRHRSGRILFSSSSRLLQRRSLTAQAPIVGSQGGLAAHFGKIHHQNGPVFRSKAQRCIGASSALGRPPTGAVPRCRRR